MSDRQAYWQHLEAIQDQLERVHEAMKTGRWWSDKALAQAVRGGEHAMSARRSDLKVLLGHATEKKHLGNRAYLYRMLPGLSATCQYCTRAAATRTQGASA